MESFRDIFWKKINPSGAEFSDRRKHQFQFAKICSGVKCVFLPEASIPPVQSSASTMHLHHLRYNNKICVCSPLEAYPAVTIAIVKLQWLSFHFEYFLKLSARVFLFGSFLLVICLTINQWEMLLSERKWHEYLTHLLSSQLTGLLIPSVFTVYSSARDKINLFASFSII